MYVLLTEGQWDSVFCVLFKELSGTVSPWVKWQPYKLLL